MQQKSKKTGDGVIIDNEIVGKRYAGGLLGSSGASICFNVRLEQLVVATLATTILLNK